jgi:hypothetical protein
MTESSGSMAVWCSSRPNAQPTSIETHFNYWRMTGRRQTWFFGKSSARDFLEVGVMVREPNSIETISIYVPFPMNGASVQDLGHHFAEPALTQGIFNEVLSCLRPSAAGQRWVDLLNQGGLSFCRVHTFSRSVNGIDPAELAIRPEASGTVLKISSQAIRNSSVGLPAGGRLYFRLRIYMDCKKKSPFVTVITPTDRHFQSGFDEVEYVDFRLNEARTLPPSVEVLMRNDMAGGCVLIERLAFLTAVPVLSELTVSNTQFHKNRLLEHGLWNSYVPGGIPKGMMVYHWSKDNAAGLEDFTAFVKLQTRRSSWFILVIYLAIAFLFGVAGNLSASAIEAWYESKASAVLQTGC